MLLRIYCIYVVQVYKSYPRCKTFISNQMSLLRWVWLRVGRRKEQVFKCMLGKSGCSMKVSDEIWKWYTAPTNENKNSNNLLWRVTGYCWRNSFCGKLRWTCLLVIARIVQQIIHITESFLTNFHKTPVSCSTKLHF